MFKRHLARVLVGILLLSGVVLLGQGGCPPPCDEVVAIPDFWLNFAVRQETGFFTPICLSDVQAITSLYAGKWSTGYGIGSVADLTGLEYFTALNSFTGDRHITDLSPLAGLSSLEYLGLDDNANLSDLSPLAGLTNLTRLNGSDTQISDLGPLAGLTNLTELNVRDNQISDLGPLVGLTNLDTLTLSENQIIDLSPLAGMTNLRVLWLWGNQIIDLGPLAGMTNLRELSLGANQIIDLSPLAGMTNLATLSLGGYQGGNQISDLTPLASLTSLHLLWLDGNQISDIYPLVSNPAIDSGDDVHIRDNPLSEESCTVYIPELESRGVYVDYDPADCP